MIDFTGWEFRFMFAFFLGQNLVQAFRAFFSDCFTKVKKDDNEEGKSEGTYGALNMCNLMIFVCFLLYEIPTSVLLIPYAIGVTLWFLLCKCLGFIFGVMGCS